MRIPTAGSVGNIGTVEFPRFRRQMDGAQLEDESGAQ
jgi:hypothetical protein